MIELQPGIHPGIDFTTYAAQPYVNAGLLGVGLTSCAAAMFHASWLNPERPEEEHKATMDLGTIAHACLLEGGSTRMEVIDPFKYPSPTSGEIPKGYTNKPIRAERDRIYAAGKIPIFKAAFDEVEQMVAQARDYLAGVQHDEPAIYAAFQPGGGDSELTLVWDDGPTRCKMRADKLNTARTVVIDYKTTEGTAEPNQWGRTQLVRMGYYTSAAFYRRGVKALTGHAPEYVYLVQERAPPYLCSLVGVDEPAFALGAQQIEYALGLWRECVRSRIWPAYPSRVCFPELPPWEQARWEEREAMPSPTPGAKSWEQQMREEKGPPLA